MTEQELHMKCLDLVWYARSPRMDDPYWHDVPDDIRKGAWASQMQVEAKYPEEVARLQCQDNGDWEHGFNSGVLAALRFLSSLNSEGEERATEDFPELYT